MKIMVTGGAGFIGSNVVDGFIRAGHRVVVVDDLSTGKMENVNPEAVFYRLDIRSEGLVEIMEKERPDVVDHHAAQMSVPISVKDPLLDADVNIRGLLNLLETCVRVKIAKFIFISSGGAVYGDAKEYPTPETYPPRPLSPYAISKFVSEYYLAYYRHQYGLDYTVLRYANIYGPRQIPHGEAGVVAVFMNNLLEGKQSVLNHFPDDAEGMTRDYCYVGDVVAANLCALDKGSGGVFNIGTGQETKTLHLYRAICETVMESRPDLGDELLTPRRSPARPGDIPRSCLVIERAFQTLGWRPETTLEKGIRQTLAWHLR